MTQMYQLGLVMLFIASAGAFSPRTSRVLTVKSPMAQTTVSEVASGASMDIAVPEEGTMMNSPAFRVLDFLFNIPIVHDLMFGIYRKQIVDKAEKMGLAWTDFMDDQWDNLAGLKAIAKRMENPDVVVPDYYYAPIHAYKDGK
jgi:hypothetical protein